MPDEATESIRDVYRATIADVYGYLLAHTGGDHSLAEELTAETYLNAANTFRDGRGHQVTIGWLKTVAKRRLIDHLRRQQRIERRATRMMNEQRGPITSGHDHADAVYEALGQLSPDHRLVLVLKHFDGLSTREIATAMGRSERSVEGLLSRSRAAFRAHFEEVNDA